MSYAIRGLVPRTDIDMGRHGFFIDLAPEWHEKVARCKELNQDSINGWIKREGRRWLDAAGYNGTYDPDNCCFDADPSKPQGPNARPMYEWYQVRVTWGEWGPEHISVPGNACGLDIDRNSFGSVFARGGMKLLPHNIDSWKQKYLLLMVFTEIAENVLLFSSLNDDAAMGAKP